jgi:hypothetical protein
VVGRYKGKVQGWDVVNEAINDGGTAETAKTENLRNSPWQRALGSDYIALAFKFAHEADPDAKLYYNDYGIEAGPKHESSMVLLRRLIKDGAPIYGVGIQGHRSTADVPYEALDKAIKDYASLGLKVSITELDVTIRGAAGGQFGPGGRPGEVKPPSPEDLKAQADAYAKLFAIFIKHKDVVERVTFPEHGRERAGEGLVGLVPGLEGHVRDRLVAELEPVGGPLQSEPADVSHHRLPHHAAEHPVEVVRGEVGNRGQVFERDGVVQVALDVHQHAEHAGLVVPLGRRPHHALTPGRFRTRRRSGLYTVGEQAA